MKVSRLTIRHFRGIEGAEFLLPKHAVLIGDNNVGKSTVFEALDLVLGPDRLNKRPPVDEHDFFQGLYRTQEQGQLPPEIRIEATITHINAEQRIRFKDYVEWWDEKESKLHTSPPVGAVDQDHITHAIRVAFSGAYDVEEDDFVGATYFPKSDEEGDRQFFTKKDKQYCGFLYLRSLRTGRRALSLERGSLLDIILRLKEIRPQMWDKTIDALANHDVASAPELGISAILESIESSIKSFVPREWGVAPHLRVSNLTREHLRSVITAFIGTGAGEHAAPFYRQGTGTINLLVLAMLSQIAKDKQNVVFAMEEPETAIPPYAQKRIVHEVRKLSTQALFTSHSPYVLEEFTPDETIVLSRGSDGILTQAFVNLPASVKHKRYRQEFRTRFCEGLLSRRILIAEGATEASAMTAVALRLSELNPMAYSPLEALGICTLDAGSETQIADLAKLYRELGKQVLAVCDKQAPNDEATIRAEVDELFMHAEKGFEALVLKNTTQSAIDRFIDAIDWPPHLVTRFPNPKVDPVNALSDYFKWSKGDHGIADFLVSCKEQEIPEWIKQTCLRIKELCESELPYKDVIGEEEAGERDGEGLV
ncbi:MAG: AAA family ATPase [Armatimonadota bacterium]